MKNKKFLAPAALLIALLMASTSVAGSEFLFNGNANYFPVVDQLNSEMAVNGILSTVGGVPTPIPVDMDNFEYTIHIEGMMVASVVNFDPPPFPRISESFNGGAIYIYEDSKATGTAADYAFPATFVDGSMILMAVVDDGWSMMLIDGTATPPGVYTGSGSGTCDFTGGSRLGELIAAEYYLQDWFFAGLDISDDNPPSTPVPANFDRSFKTKLVPPNDPTPSEDSTWGQVKKLYQ